MKNIDKCGILISWPREIDMFSFLIDDQDFPSNIIVDDMKYSEAERKGNSLNISNLLKDRGLEFNYVSDVLNISKYNVLLSTAQSFKEVVTVSSYIKYIYAQVIGNFFDKVGISTLLVNYFSRPFNGGGSKSKKFKFVHVERVLGRRTVKFPKGLDVSSTMFPNERWKCVFDLYLCHGNVDYNLILKKFPDSKCVKIGYPRYDNVIGYDDACKIISNDFKEIDLNKKTILWVPAHNKFRCEIASNIKLWIPIIKKLTKTYNVIIRPHPKTLVIMPDLVKLLQKHSFIIDAKYDRELSVLYKFSSLILADYGGSVLDSIYMEKKIILLNMPKKYEFYKWRILGGYIDKDVRKDTLSIEYGDDLNLTEQVNKVISCDDIDARVRLKDKYFGLNSSFMKKEFIKKLMMKDSVMRISDEC